MSGHLALVLFGLNSYNLPTSFNPQKTIRHINKCKKGTHHNIAQKTPKPQRTKTEVFALRYTENTKKLKKNKILNERAPLSLGVVVLFGTT